jgi:hypothetical protein
MRQLPIPVAPKQLLPKANSISKLQLAAVLGISKTLALKAAQAKRAADGLDFVERSVGAGASHGLTPDQEC